MEKKFKNGKVATFMKRNMYYIIMVACIIAIGIMITIAALNNNKPTEPGGGGVVIEDPTDNEDPIDNPDDDKPVVLVFGLPVANAEISQNASYDALLFHKTLDCWQFHGGIDFMTAEAADVVAVEAGTITDVSTDILYGTVVTIKHNDKITSVYKSLSDVTLQKGAAVTKGQVLGKTSTSAGFEADEGIHVHFEMYNAGEMIDPNTLLPIEDK